MSCCCLSFKSPRLFALGDAGDDSLLEVSVGVLGVVTKVVEVGGVTSTKITLSFSLITRYGHVGGIGLVTSFLNHGCIHLYIFAVWPKVGTVQSKATMANNTALIMAFLQIIYVLNKIAFFCLNMRLNSKSSAQMPL